MTDQNRTFKSKIIFRKGFYRKGFNLLEVSIALSIGTSMMIMVYSLIAKGIQLQREATHINNAVQLTKIKMSQIESSTKFETNRSTGEVPGYPGYSFVTEIVEEELDLLKLASGKGVEDAKKRTPKDLLKSADAGMNDLLKKRGQATSSATGGLLKVFHIKVSIIYPNGTKKETYTAETFKSTKY